MSIRSIKIDEVPNIESKISDPGYLMRKYSEDNCRDFNDVFFQRTDEDLIKELEKLILSWQREKYFILRVIDFTVEKSHARIEEILIEHEKAKNKDKGKNKAIINEDIINLKDSDVMLLIVTYYIEVLDKEGPNKNKQTEDTLQVLILVPRIVDQYYFKIKGNIYCPVYQIVDGSVYNNSDKINSKSDAIAFKAERPIRIIRHQGNLQQVIINNTNLEYRQLPNIIYTSNIFGKPGMTMKFIFAKFGLLHGLGFLGLQGITVIQSNQIQNRKDEYIFATYNPNIFVKVPKVFYDNDIVTQSAVGTLCLSILPGTNFNEIFTISYWEGSLHSNFKAAKGTVKSKVELDSESGKKVLYDLEIIYSIKNRELLKLPEDDKITVYHVLRWIMGEFNELRARDNIDIYYKRVRFSEYIAALYGAKLSKAILDLSNYRKNNLTLDYIKSRIDSSPDFLIQAITKDSLVGINNRVNDNSAFSCLKASYKGTSGIGENSKNSISDRYRTVHYSHAGVVDMTSSSASDPGTTTLLCPMGKMQDDGFFYDYKEPNGWEESYKEIVNNYNTLNKLKDCIGLESELLNKGRNYYAEQHMVLESLEMLKRLIEPFKTLEYLPMIHIVPKYELEESKSIIYESEAEDFSIEDDIYE